MLTVLSNAGTSASQHPFTNHTPRRRSVPHVLQRPDRPEALRILQSGSNKLGLTLTVLTKRRYIRKPTAICKPDGSEEVKCLMYYSAQTAQKMEEVDKGIASCVTEYTMEMAASQGYKRCCLVS
jgi:hypothetical protein